MKTNVKMFGMIMAVTMVFVATQVSAISADAVKGKAIFKDSCSSFRCHAMDADYLVGWPVPEMLERVDEYKKMENAGGRVAKMRANMISLSEQELLDVATYLNEAK